MPEVIFAGPTGRLEGRYQHQKHKTAPIALILHPHPQFGGTMNNRVVYEMFYCFQRRGCSVMRFNFRGVGRSQGSNHYSFFVLRSPTGVLGKLHGSRAVSIFWVGIGGSDQAKLLFAAGSRGTNWSATTATP